MKNQNFAEFLSFRSSWLKTINKLEKRAKIFLVDLLSLIYLWLIASYTWNLLFHRQESFQSLAWWVILPSIIGIVTIWEIFGLSLGTKLIIGLDSKVKPKRKWYLTSWGIAVLLLTVLTFLTAFSITEVDLKAFLTGAAKSKVIWRGLVTPNWSIITQGIDLLVVTIFMALMATFFALPLAIPLSFLAARNLMKGPRLRLIYILIRTVMSITRSIEPIIWAIIFVIWVRLGPFAGMLALTIHSVADLTKLYSERLESIDEKPVETVRATGARGWQVTLYGIVPQIINPYLSFTLYRWDINVRMSTIIGIVGGGGIGQQLYLYTNLWKWHEVGLLMWLIVIVVWVIDYTSSRLRDRLEKGAKGREEYQG